MQVDPEAVIRIMASTYQYHSAPLPSYNVSYRDASKCIGTWHAATHNRISNNTVFDNDVGILVGVGVR
jgi:hypothetical protein